MANLSLWSKADYESHWTRELKSLFEGAPKAALVVSYDDPEAASNMEIWKVYRDGEWLHFQNQIPWYSNFPKEFEISEISRYIDDREGMTTERLKFSEWNVSIRDIETYLHRCGAV